MEPLREITESDIRLGAINMNEWDFHKFQATRAVVTNDAGNVALLHVGHDHYHELPGGSVEAGEDLEHALLRGLTEKLRPNIVIMAKLGHIIEYMPADLHSEIKIKKAVTSHGFIANYTGELVTPRHTQREAGARDALVWVTNIPAALEELERDNPLTDTGLFGNLRDRKFLETAMELLKPE